MYSIVSTAIIYGIRSIPVFVEADVSGGLPTFEMVGFLASEVKESKERVRTALKNSGFVIPPKRITVNFTPANIRKSGSGFDLPIAVAVLAALGEIKIKNLDHIFLIGEVGLDGRLQPVSGILPMAAEAKERGITKCIVPLQNRAEAMLVSDVKVYGADTIQTVVKILNGERLPEQTEAYNIEETAPTVRDFSEIKGQPAVRRACETAVSGMHNILFIGPPGAGKTMIAERIPTILPPLSREEQIEISKIYSVKGMFKNGCGLLRERPFRAPHHTISVQGLAGGGSVPRPGEISLAHKGVLFLDELAEFKKETLEILRQPMEDGKISIVRVGGSCEYPADFMLAAAMNPCKCGYYPDENKCTCSRTSVRKYMQKISGPLLDRMDLCVEAKQIRFEDLQKSCEGEEKEESSAVIRERVERTRAIQEYRYRKETFSCNSQIPSSRILEFCALDEKQEAYMGRMYEKLGLTARSYHKILKVARTLADMEESERIELRHLTEAVCFRSVDRTFWEGRG